MRIVFQILFLFFFAKICVAQSLFNFKGKITDSLQNPINEATLVFIDIDKIKVATFTKSDNNGNFTIKLSQETTYSLELSHLSYGLILDTVRIKKNDLIKNYKLKEQAFDLDAVLLEVEKAISVKGDTTIYNVDSFIDGTEQKLKDIIEKLPGASIDDGGNVIYKGKKVNVSQIENREFFNGNSKLAATHIPADAIDKIEFIENYSPSKILKGLEESDRIAMNLKLKEGKKRFAFGDVTAQAGIEERYLFSPTLFYYSPKNSINAIADLNNINKNSFTLSDFLAFDDYYNQITETGIKKSTNTRLNYQDIKNSDDLLNNRLQFYTAQHTGQINNKSDISSYIIHLKSNNQAINNVRNEYLDNSVNNELIKQRATENKKFTLGKIVYDLYGDSKIELKSTTRLKIESPQILYNQSVNRGVDEFISIDFNKGNRFSLNQDLTTIFKLSEKQTINTLLEWNYTNDNNDLNIIADESLFENLLNNSQEQTILSNNRQNEGMGIRLAISDYIKISDFSHLKVLAGLGYSNYDYTTLNFQTIDGSINNLETFGFNNDINTKQLNTFLKTTFKILLGNYIIEPSLSLDYLRLNVSTIDQSKRNNTIQVLPSIKIITDYSQAEKFTFSSQYKIKPISAIALFEKLDILSFNRVSSGNPTLFFTKQHSSYLNYRNFNWSKQFNIFGNITYNRDIISNISNSTIQSGEVVNRLEEFNEDVHNIFSSIHFDKKIKKIKLSLDAGYRYTEFVSSFNGEINTVNSNRYKIGNSLDFKLSKKLDFDFSWSYSLREANYANRFVKTSNFNYDFELNYKPIKGFIGTLVFNSEEFKNQTNNSSNNFYRLDFDFRYKSPKGMTTYFIDVNNLLNTDITQSVVTNSFVVTEQSRSYFPRVITAGITYAF